MRSTSDEASSWEKAREAAYRAISDRAGDLVLVSDWNTARFVHANDMAIERLGYSLTELRRMTGGDMSQQTRDEHRRFSEELIQHGHTHASAVRVRCRDGRMLTMALWVQRFRTQEGDYHVTVLRDSDLATDLRPDLRADTRQIRESEALYRGIVTCTEDAVIVTDLETMAVVEANPSACSLFGHSTVAWRHLTRAHLCADAKAADALERELSVHGRAQRIEVELTRASGDTFFADTLHNAFQRSGRTLVVTLVRDVSARRTQRRRLERAQRLAAMGEVAAGVAHEINNPAAAGMLNCSALLNRLREADRLAADLGAPALSEALAMALAAASDTMESLERVKSIAQDLRPFWRNDSRVTAVAVNDVVQATVDRLHNEIRHRASVHLDLQPDLPDIAMWDGQLEQVLSNILLNATQAIVEGRADANQIGVRTRATDASIAITITDTGSGMSEATLQRLFEPFFSTKPADQGTGLGMALSAEIVQAHRGHIEAESTLDAGTQVHIEFPFDTGVSPSVSQPTPPPREARRILVIDDDQSMVRAYRRVLRNRDAVVVDSGREALDLLSSDRDFDLIVCDLMMPEVDGPAVYESLKQSAPDLAGRVVFCTGGAITPRMQAFVASVDNEVLNKPLSPRDLRELFHSDP